MNKSLFVLVFALPFLAACWGKKEAEVIKTEIVEEMVPVADEADEATGCTDEISEEDADHEHNEK